MIFVAAISSALSPSQFPEFNQNDEGKKIDSAAVRLRPMLTVFSQLIIPNPGLLSIPSLIFWAQTMSFILIKILDCFSEHSELSLVSKLAL